MKKTKIVATIGPASANEKILKNIIKSGVNVARMNFSHGDFEEHAHKVKLVRAITKKLGLHVAIMQDLGGPKIRTGDLKEGSVFLKGGAQVILTTKKVEGTAEKMSVNYKGLPKDVATGHRILLNDGRQELVVRKVVGVEIYCKVKHGGKIASRRAVCLPDTMLSTPSFTIKDRRDLEFGIKHAVEFIALSFVQSGKDILALKNTLKKRSSKAMVVAKIETQNAIKNIDEILLVADAIMVARGDLAVEVGATRVPMLQKDIVKKANALGKPVIVATQMLETMTDCPVPTRAEVSDVANAILDGADAVMLSGETALGGYPSETVKEMASIAVDTEKHMDFNRRLNVDYAKGTCMHTNEVVARNAAKVARDLCAEAIVAFTETGTTSRGVAKFRVKQPIFVISQNKYALQQTTISFGVYPTAKVSLTDGDNVNTIARTAVLNSKIAKKGDKIVVVSGSIFGKPGETNTISVITV